MKIHRFKCSAELNQEIMNFSQIHKFDVDETLSEHFTEWLEQHNDLITRESEYLKRHEYDEPIETKIYKSIKYYYMKKFTTEPPKKKEKKKAVKIDPQIMQQIKADLDHHFQTNPDFKPSETYEQFKKNDDPLVKKSYKNQYYQIKNKRYNINERQFS
jgi:hypothetical protein